MKPGDRTLRRLIIEAVCGGVQTLPTVLAGWESGSIAFGLDDAYSDIDVNFLLDDSFPADTVFNAVASALDAVSPVVTSHASPPGRYFKLRDADEYLLVDVCLYRTEDVAERLDADRHGNVRTLFDKAAYLHRDPDSVKATQTMKRQARLQEHQEWFAINQSFVRKAIIRGRDVEALAGYWAYTLKPLVELLRMRHCPTRWDFGMRYLDRDLPNSINKELGRLVFVGESDDLPIQLSEATAWAEQLMRDMSGEKADS